MYSKICVHDMQTIAYGTDMLSPFPEPPTIQPANHGPKLRKVVVVVSTTVFSLSARHVARPTSKLQPYTHRGTLHGQGKSAL